MDEATFLAEYQPRLLLQMKKMMEHERLAHAYLFEGDQGTGKQELAMWVAKRLFCEQPIDGNPCNHCLQCIRIEQGEHPNVRTVEPDGQTIKVDQIRQLQSEFSKSGFETKEQCFIIRSADKMSVSAANSLLKFLEEPSGTFVAILETNALGKILPTIQSRCQIIHFSPLSKEKLTQALIENGISATTASILVRITNSFDKAVEISSNEWFNDARNSISKWFQLLTEKKFSAFLYVQKQLVPLAKEREQQEMCLLLLQISYQQALQKGFVSSYDEVALILEAKMKLSANVSFQNVAEQLVLRILNE